LILIGAEKKNVPAKTKKKLFVFDLDSWTVRMFFIKKSMQFTKIYYCMFYMPNKIYHKSVVTAQNLILLIQFVDRYKTINADKKYLRSVIPAHISHNTIESLDRYLTNYAHKIYITNQ
jgi:hypothetical protein